ncbi:Ribosomal RNA small subunit methyltransferase A [Candidatus Hodgkinia cicadicola]|nr:Ribosomal RNA small subunit methyltransferase A [Candidatus Hodgkinia cicadicola]
MKAWPGKIDLIIRDAIKINYRALVLGSKLNLLASSLPFHIASRLLILLSCLSCLMLVIFQKEVFLRMKSSYSSLSLIFMKYNIMKLFDIPSFRFLPKPNVFCVCVLMTPIASVCSNTICNLINTMRRFNRICNAK